MAYNCGDCDNNQYACMAWDGNGNSIKPKVEFKEGERCILEKGGYPNHNLSDCPKGTCTYRLKKTPSQQLIAR